MVKMGLLLWAMYLHFVADFLLQSREMGQKKSSELKWLLAHVGIQFLVLFLGLWLLLPRDIALLLSGANALIHGTIDWFIWKGYKKFVERRLYEEGPDNNNNPAHNLWQNGEWQYWKDSWFYTTIGFDQMLHVMTLILILSFV